MDCHSVQLYKLSSVTVQEGEKKEELSRSSKAMIRVGD